MPKNTSCKVYIRGVGGFRRAPSKLTDLPEGEIYHLPIARTASVLMSL
jgi:hypothetical protein